MNAFLAYGERHQHPRQAAASQALVARRREQTALSQAYHAARRQWLDKALDCAEGPRVRAMVAWIATLGPDDADELVEVVAGEDWLLAAPQQGRVADDLLELLADGVPPRRRSDLGDLDQGLWELDDRKQPRDPWQFTNELVLRGLETGDEFVFATSSKGGLGAVGELCKAYGRLYRQKPGLLPVIELQADHYTHKTFGKTYYPVLRLVDWIAETDAAVPPAEAAVPPAPSTAPPAAPPKAPEPPAPKRTRF